MTTKPADTAVLELILTSFQRELCRLRGGWLSRLLFGEPPTVGYAEQFAAVDERGHLSGDALAVWRVTTTHIERMPASFQIPEPTYRRGMYFEPAHFAFTLPDECDAGVVSSQVGPRFGIGHRYRVVAEQGTIKVQAGERLWIS